MATVDLITSFALDRPGRFICNTMAEAIASIGQPFPGDQAGDFPRDFDVIIIGGGTFASVAAQHLLATDATRSRRILVVEEGPYSLPEHQQNLPMMRGVTPPMIAPWTPKILGDNPGLLFSLAGRSLAWGGWSPELLPEETTQWPTGVANELRGRYFKEASREIGVVETNDFIFGPLHDAMRQRLHDGVPKRIRGAVQFAELLDHPQVRYGGTAIVDLTEAQLSEWLGLEPGSAPSKQEMLDLLKLEAPLAVQSRTETGLFPFNKFSAMPLLIKATRQAATEAEGEGPTADARKRLMVVPKWHVVEIVTETQPDNWVRVTGVRVGQNHSNSNSTHFIPLAPGGVVIVGLGTVESTRIAELTFQQSLSWRSFQRMGHNLMAHLRSNLDIRIPRKSLEPLLSADIEALQTSALLLKGKVKDRFFHLQITASGLGPHGTDSEAELFKKIPDLDGLEVMQSATDDTVVITIRGIGEMEPEGSSGRPQTAPGKRNINLNGGGDFFGREKATVQLTQTANDDTLWKAMDEASDDVAKLFAGDEEFEVKTGDGWKSATKDSDLNAIFEHKKRHDGLGTTHHEAGSLWMGDDPATSVTNEYGRLHDTANCYFAGPALFPTIGSPNPMLTGTALTRRTVDLLNEKVLPKPPVVAATATFKALFDGTTTTFRNWRKVGSNGFSLINGEIITYGGGDLGLLYYAAEAFANFTLKVQFRIFENQRHNSGVFVRFANPENEMTEEIQARLARLGQSGGAWTAVESGFEIQINDNGATPNQQTGAIYEIPVGDPSQPVQQQFQRGPDIKVGNSYEFEITVEDDDHNVTLTNITTGERVHTTFYHNVDKFRGVARKAGKPVGHIGVQSHFDCRRIAFRSIQIKG